MLAFELYSVRGDDMRELVLLEYSNIYIRCSGTMEIYMIIIHSFDV